ALDRAGVASEPELFEAMGRGRISPADVLDAIFPGLKVETRAAATAERRIEDGKAARLFVRGSSMTAATKLHFAQCCTPVPGDRIVGIQQDDGASLTVHTIDCPTLAQYEDREELWRDL